MIELATEPDARVIERSWTDPEAFAALFDRHAREIHRYAAWRLGEPPGLRRAAVEVLAETPGVTITPGETDLRGREGIAISGPRSAPDWRIILDPETYAYLGFRDTFVRDDGVTVTRASALTDFGVADAVGDRP